MKVRTIHKWHYHITNSITAYRLLAAPVLGALAVDRQIELFRWLLAVSFFTDMIDGWLARRFEVSSKWGAILDSLADDCTVFAGIIGVIFLKPLFFSNYLPFVMPVLLLLLLQMGFAFIRYKRISSYHTYLAKLAALLQGSFLILLFFLSQPPYWLFFLAMAITVAELLEELVLVVLLPKWETDVKGLYWVLKRKRTQL